MSIIPFRTRLRLILGWVACNALIYVIPANSRLWWALLPTAGFYAHFDRTAIAEKEHTP